MTNRKIKIFVLLLDGVSLRNFAYAQFCKIAEDRNMEVVFWHDTPFDLGKLGFNQLKLPTPRLNWLTSVLKNARKRIELARFSKRYNDPIYYHYSFPLKFNGFKASIKNGLTHILCRIFNSEWGLNYIRNSIHNLEQRSTYYEHCKRELELHQPDLLYCTSQRSILAVAPLMAAKKLQIPTVCFIYSWDNLPKATLDVMSDHYHVWSDHMKNELITYHPFIKPEQVYVTGTPQFEPHYDEDLKMSRSDFCDRFSLDPQKRYLCFSGDDITTSPKDPMYLRDVARALMQLNEQGNNFGLIFRRCPVDFSNRYDEILSEYSHLIHPIDPIWKQLGTNWDAKLPMREDLQLLSNLAIHTEAVINLGSSMVFDFVIHGKPCFYLNYNYLKNDSKLDLGVFVYDYVHFRSKPTENVVVWLNQPQEIAEKIEETLQNPNETIKYAHDWFNIINKGPQQNASERIVDGIIELATKYNSNVV